MHLRCNSRRWALQEFMTEGKSSRLANKLFNILRRKTGDTGDIYSIYSAFTTDQLNQMWNWSMKQRLLYFFFFWQDVEQCHSCPGFFSVYPWISPLWNCWPCTLLMQRLWEGCLGTHGVLAAVCYKVKEKYFWMDSKSRAWSIFFFFPHADTLEPTH